MTTVVLAVVMSGASASSGGVDDGLVLGMIVSG